MQISLLLSSIILLLIILSLLRVACTSCYDYSSKARLGVAKTLRDQVLVGLQPLNVPFDDLDGLAHSSGSTA